MSKVEAFLTAEQEAKLVLAIQEAEKNTSGEIRVHIEKETQKPPMERALEVFELLQMHKTELRNAVLFYIAVESKKFAILGDEGINNVVSNDFWNNEKELMLNYFSQGQFEKGIELAIVEVGNKLKAFFPYQKSDSNELTDEISKG
jgi:uncharacterized membrane protein